MTQMFDELKITKKEIKLVKKLAKICEKKNLYETEEAMFNILEKVEYS
tara:strand:- start:5743 stop:5886 length:144 start_codon:yes stop_codon:yes gene_type:complete